MPLESHGEALGWVVLGTLIRVSDVTQFTEFCHVPKLGFRSVESCYFRDLSATAVQPRPEQLNLGGRAETL